MEEFDRLYQGRNTTLYPHPNPMRKDLRVQLDDTYTILNDTYTIDFPIGYNLEQSIQGVEDLTFVPHSVTGKVQIASDDSCLYSPGNDAVQMAECEDGAANQVFTYDTTTLHIKHLDYCLDYDPSTPEGFVWARDW